MKPLYRGRLARYVVLLALVALLKFHLDWFDGVRMHGKELPDAVRDALVSGALFFFALTLSMAVFCELSDNAAVSKRPAVSVLKWLCWAPLVLLVFVYFSVRYGAVSPDFMFYLLQSLVGVLSLGVAAVAKWYIYSTDTTP